jgi:DNA-binding XRE family transcriptional regulator
MHAGSFSTEEVAVMERQAMGRLFGHGIEQMRKNTGLSIDEAAVAAGMEATEWLAIEAGRVPNDWEQLRTMGAAINLRPEQIAIYASICKRARQQ